VKMLDAKVVQEGYARERTSRSVRNVVVFNPQMRTFVYSVRDGIKQNERCSIRCALGVGYAFKALSSVLDVSNWTHTTVFPFSIVRIYNRNTKKAAKYV